MSDDNLEGKADDLIKAVTALKNDISITASLSKRTVDTEKTTKRLRRWAVATTVGLILDLFLSGVGIWLFVDASQQRETIRSTINQVQRNTLRLDNVQQILSKDVLCPLYKVFIQSYNTSDIKPDDLAAYEERYRTFRRGNLTLGCETEKQVLGPYPRQHVTNISQRGVTSEGILCSTDTVNVKTVLVGVAANSPYRYPTDVIAGKAVTLAQFEQTRFKGCELHAKNCRIGQEFDGQIATKCSEPFFNTFSAEMRSINATLRPRDKWIIVITETTNGQILSTTVEPFSIRK